MAKNTSPILAIAFTLASVVLFFSSSGAALAQSPQSGSQPQQPQPEPEAGVDDDPTRAVFWSVREEYRNLTNGAWNNRLILRKDKVVLRGNRFGGRTGFLMRTDIPLTTTHVATGTNTGLGDIYGQALYIPYFKGKFAFVTGSGVVFPTATHKTLGQGKWQIAPLAVPVWFLAKKKESNFQILLTIDSSQLCLQNIGDICTRLVIFKKSQERKKEKKKIYTNHLYVSTKCYALSRKQ